MISAGRLSGFLVVDKAAGVTSHDVVGMVRAVSGTKKVGHTGTLDPFATGVLPLALGPCTRLIQFLDEGVKVYDATLLLGQRTDTGDLDGEVVAEVEVPPMTEESVQAVLLSFLGEQLQTPPAYSAVRKDGKRLYEYAREGKAVTVPPRGIVVHSMELLELSASSIRFRVRCGRGTYVRVLGEDIATELGTVGHLIALRRERSGPFGIETAVSVQHLADLVAAEPGQPWEQVLRGRKRDGVPWRPRELVREALGGKLVGPLDALDHLPRQPVDEATTARVRHGQSPPPLADASPDGRYIITHEEKLVAVARMQGERARLERVFNDAST